MRPTTTLRALILAVLLATTFVGDGAAQEVTPTPVALPSADAVCADVLAAGTPVAGAMLVVLPEAEIAFDLLLLDLLIPHHETTLQIATIASERGQHVEVRELAARVFTAQTAELAQLRGWRDAWFPGAPALDATTMIAVLDQTMGADPGMGGVAGAADVLAPRDLVPLCMADTAEFDAVFLETMMAHQQGAALLAGEAIARSERTEVRELAATVQSALQADIAQMAAWLEGWYPGRSACQCEGHQNGTLAPTAAP